MTGIITRYVHSIGLWGKCSLMYLKCAKNRVFFIKNVRQDFNSELENI